jgi:HEAT repeat protein
MEALKDPDAKVRSNAATSLGEFASEGKQSVPVLMGVLSDENIEVQRAAILALGRLGKGADGVEEALRKFADTPDPVTKMDVTIALASLGKMDDADLPVLLKAVGSRVEATSKGAGKVLGDVGLATPDKVMPGIMEALEKNDKNLSRNALRVLRHMKGQAAPALPGVVAMYDKADPITRLEIVDTILVLDRQGDYAIPVLTKALESPQPKDRREALMGLLRFRNKVNLFLPSLIEALSDKDAENQILAIAIVKGLGHQATKAVPTLIELMEHNNLKVRTAAIAAISAFTPPTPEILQALDQQLKDQEAPVRIAAVGSLRRIGYVYPDKVAGMLKSALDGEKDEQTRKAISSALEKVSDHPPKASAPLHGTPAKQETKAPHS